MLLIAGASLLILGLLEGGVLWPWASLPSIGTLGGGAVLLVVFGLVERRAAEPILPGWVFRSRLLNATNVAALAVGVMLIGLTSYVPLFAQGVLGTSALVAGFALAALTLGWPLAASLAGRIYLRIGFRRHGADRIRRGHRRRGAARPALARQFGLAGRRDLLRARPRHGPVRQPDPDRRPVGGRLARRGVVTGTNMFARSMGSALGIAVFGAIANATLSQRLGRPRLRHAPPRSRSPPSTRRCTRSSSPPRWSPCC